MVEEISYLFSDTYEVCQLTILHSIKGVKAGGKRIWRESVLELGTVKPNLRRPNTQSRHICGFQFCTRGSRFPSALRDNTQAQSVTPAQSQTSGVCHKVLIFPAASPPGAIHTSKPQGEERETKKGPSENRGPSSVEICNLQRGNSCCGGYWEEKPP